MTAEKLREWLLEEAAWCSCGDPAAAAGFLLGVLDLHPLYDHRDEFEALLPDAGLQYFVLYTIDGLGLAEHGGSIGGQWLTPYGEEVRAALRFERDLDGFESLFDPPVVEAPAPDLTPEQQARVDQIGAELYDQMSRVAKGIGATIDRVGGLYGSVTVPCAPCRGTGLARALEFARIDTPAGQVFICPPDMGEALREKCETCEGAGRRTLTITYPDPPAPETGS